MDVCEDCIEIAKRDLKRERWWGNRREVPWKLQCGCGCWWELKHPRTIRMHQRWGTQEWYRDKYPGFVAYRPVECQQRRCQEHAKHKVKVKRNYRYKCDRHAGVCLVA